MRRLLIRLCLWLLTRLGADPPCPLAHWPLIFSDLLTRARGLVAQQEQDHPEPGLGEVKRHRVFAQLRKEFKNVDQRMLALAIERAQWPVKAP